MLSHDGDTHDGDDLLLSEPDRLPRCSTNLTIVWLLQLYCNALNDVVAPALILYLAHDELQPQTHQV